jgi:aldose 1-epimerase
MKFKKNTFGYIDNVEVKQFVLANNNNLTVKIINYGGIITSIDMPDKNGNIDNIVCGFDNLDAYISKEYLENYPYFGAIIGRCANRIDKGSLEIEGNTFQLAINNGNSHLHGGFKGFDKRLWEYEVIEKSDEIGVKLTYISPDMEENYPGNLIVNCIYTLNNKNELSIEFFAKTDKTTIVNLTNHSYFNLTGGKDDILNHELKLSSSKMTETVEDNIPTGKIISVKNTAHDFANFKSFQKHIEKLSTGYDNNFIIAGEMRILKYAGTLRENISKRQVDIFTTQPGLQVYTGYWIPDLVINGKRRFGKYSGVALETQHFPDAIHHKNFPSTVLKPRDIYNQKTVFKFKI